MTGASGTTMSGDESFLARWSRRKRRAAPKTSDQAPPDAADRAAPIPPAEAPPSVDPALLPPIESIGAGSDIRAFLAAGVPADLTRAALRRAWSADPAIRDFIGLSENSWDFTAPGGVPGFGEITQDEVRRLLGQLTGENDATEPERPAADTAAANQAGPAAQGTTPSVVEIAQDSTAGQEQENAAAQHESRPPEQRPLPRRSHGGALPK
jgi:hypothetical protein